MKSDMSAQAITARLRHTSELRRLCLALGAKTPGRRKQARTDKKVRKILLRNSD